MVHLENIGMQVWAVCASLVVRTRVSAEQRE
jgi:hypothetical protein